MSASPIKFTLENDDGEEIEYSLPGKYEVCSGCGGEGKHVDRNIDGNGITASEWAEMRDDDPDFSENYTSGRYDVTCEDCHGKRVEHVVDEEHLTEEQKDLYERYCESQSSQDQYDYEDAYTRRMEGG